MYNVLSIMEVLVIFEKMKKCRSCLLGLSLKIITDSAAFTKTLEKKDVAT